jgi:hypothetical protein
MAPAELLESGVGLEPSAPVPTESIQFEEVLKPVEQETAESLSTESVLPGEAIQLKPLNEKLDKEGAEAVNFAREDIAQKLSVEASAVELVAYEKIVWRDGSLGCPLPDMMYTQAMVDGYVIQMRVDGQIYSYHGARGRDPFLCETDQIGRDSTAPTLRNGELATPPGEE